MTNTMTEREVEQSFKDQKKKRKKYGKSYEVIKASRKSWSDFGGIDVDGKVLDFGPSGALRLHDERLARDVHQALGTGPNPDVVVVEVDDVPDTREARDHTNFHGGMPAMPWHEA